MTYSKADLITAILNETDFVSSLHPSTYFNIPPREELEEMSFEELADIALLDPTYTIDEYIDIYGSWYDEHIHKI